MYIYFGNRSKYMTELVILQYLGRRYHLIGWKTKHHSIFLLLIRANFTLPAILASNQPPKGLQLLNAGCLYLQSKYRCLFIHQKLQDALVCMGPAENIGTQC